MATAGAFFWRGNNNNSNNNNNKHEGLSVAVAAAAVGNENSNNKNININSNYFGRGGGWNSSRLFECKLRYDCDCGNAVSSALLINML
jgi:hypothetical protein